MTTATIRAFLWNGAAMLAAASSAHGAVNSACLLTPAELQAATGRTFENGQAGDNALDGAVQCYYTERGKPQRKLTVGIAGANAKAQFESRIRLLKVGKEPIDLTGVGDAAYFNGTSAGVLAGPRLITLSGLRRASDPKVAPDRAADLLRTALKRAASNG
jgi:hypothetical protein